MSLAGSRVGIVGGSIGGCAAAIALRHAGCQVTVFERSSSLADRGHGVMIPEEVWTDLVGKAYFDAETPTRRCLRRSWMIPDPSRPGGRSGWQHPLAARQMNWGTMWHSLRVRVPDSAYRTVAVRTIETGQDGVTLGLDDGTAESFDVVVGADGYRSSTRTLAVPDASVEYAGYLMWRGTFPVEQLPSDAPAELSDSVVFVGQPYGHLGGYLIPNATGDGWLMNWFCYATLPRDGEFAEPTFLAAGAVPDEVLDRLYALIDESAPAAWRGIIRVSPRAAVAVQPIYDAVTPTYVADRVLLIGDASAMARPHAGAGATKTMVDATALERICAEHTRWDTALAAYDAERCAAGNGLVALARRLADALVLRPPAWETMTGRDVEAIHRAAFAGTPLPYDIGATTPARTV